MALNAESASDHRSDEKRVRWALNLEEIVYFTTTAKGQWEGNEFGALQSAMTKLFRTKFVEQKGKHDEIANGDLFHVLQQKIQDLAARFPRRCSATIAHKNHLNKPRGELVQLFGVEGRYSSCLIMTSNLNVASLIWRLFK